jgi:hypothetical protein
MTSSCNARATPGRSRWAQLAAVRGCRWHAALRPFGVICAAAAPRRDRMDYRHEPRLCGRSRGARGGGRCDLPKIPGTSERAGAQAPFPGSAPGARRVHAAIAAKGVPRRQLRPGAPHSRGVAHAQPPRPRRQLTSLLAPLPQETEMVAAGFPCVDVSRAGLRRGIDGQASLALACADRSWRHGQHAMRVCHLDMPAWQRDRNRQQEVAAAEPLPSAGCWLSCCTHRRAPAWCATCFACWRTPSTTSAPCPGCSLRT